MPRRQGVCVFTGPTSVTQTLSPTHREGGATLLAPGHVWWPGVQPPLDLNQSPPTQLGQPLPGCTSDAHIGYPRADRVRNGGAASPPPPPDHSDPVRWQPAGVITEATFLFSFLQYQLPDRRWEQPGTPPAVDGFYLENSVLRSEE